MGVSHRLKDRHVLKYILKYVRGTLNILNLHIEVLFEAHYHMLAVIAALAGLLVRVESCQNLNYHCRLTG